MTTQNEEAIARLVDPEAWRRVDRWRGPPEPHHFVQNPAKRREFADEIAAPSLSKARQIIAYRSQQKGEGEPNFAKVRRFHEAFDIPILAAPSIPADRVDLRLRLIDEERDELTEAIQANDIVEVADALTDIAYLVYGTALEFGIDLDACFAEVHRSNMSKLGADGKPILREDGKVMKGPNYFRPNLAPYIALPTRPQPSPIREEGGGDA